jgi:tetratricopeptide (TPR) repeat protein
MIKKTLLTIGIVLFSLMSYAQTVLQQAEKAFNACNYMDAAQLYDMQASTTGDETERTKLYDLANKCREIATLRTQANNAYKAKNYKTAMATYAKILKLNPKDKLAKNRKTECFDIINSVNVIVTADPQCDIYIDGEYKAKGSWEGRLFVKTYRFEARMEACEPSVKDVTLEKGNDVTITLDMPKQETTVDGNYLGTSPLTEELPYGSHTDKAIRNSKEVSKTINVSKSGGDNDVVLSFNEINGHEYVDLGLPSGLKWATYNVGARSPEDYGDYYAWGETKTKSQYYCGNGCATDKYGYDMKDISGNTEFDVARLKWGSTWRMPTKAEFEELNSECTWTWTTKNGVNGYEVTGPNDNSIFLPAAGYCCDVRIFDKGSIGHYWSSTPANLGAIAFQIGSNGHFVPGWKCRGDGRTIRPVTQ